MKTVIEGQLKKLLNLEEPLKNSITDLLQKNSKSKHDLPKYVNGNYQGGRTRSEGGVFDSLKKCYFPILLVYERERQKIWRAG